MTGKTLIIEAGGRQKQLVEDDMRKNYEEAEKAKLANAKGSGKFG